MPADFKTPTPEMTALLQRAGNHHEGTAHAAQVELAKALSPLLRQGILEGSILGDVYESIYFPYGTHPEFPMDIVSPGTEDSLIAYTCPAVGRIPERHFESDFLAVNLYDTAASADTNLRYIAASRWDVVGRIMQMVEAMFLRKFNVDAWRVILSAGVARNLVVYDDAATAGLFTKRLVALMETVMRRNGGGNSTSVGRAKLTDLFVSPELHQDVLSWDLTQVPEALRTSIYTNWAAGGVTQIGSVRLHDLDELGVGQDFQTYLVAQGATLPTDKLEFVVGLDLQNRDSFVHPWREMPQVFEDPALHRQRRWGVYGWQTSGWALLDARRVVLGAA